MGVSVKEIVASIKAVLPKQRPIEHHTPYYGKREANHVAGCMGSGIQRYTYIQRFEELLCKITGAEQAVAVSSGTAALHLALMAVGVKPGDEVICPTSTFVGTANAICHAGAIPHFLDCHLGLRPFKLRRYLAHITDAAPDKIGRINKVTGRRISAVVPVHLLGIPVDIEELVATAREFGLKVVEDAAQALGSTFNGKHCGTFGDAGILSFNNNKIVTTNGGGAVLTSSEWIAAEVARYATTARKPHQWLIEHDAVAWNYRMGTINAAFGLGQLESLDEALAAKCTLISKYKEALPNTEFVDVPKWLPTAVSNNWLTTILVDWRDELLDALHKEGLLARALFTPLHHLPMYEGNPRNAKNMTEADALFNKAVCLPSGVMEISR